MDLLHSDLRRGAKPPFLLRAIALSLGAHFFLLFLIDYGQWTQPAARVTKTQHWPVQLTVQLQPEKVAIGSPINTSTPAAPPVQGNEPRQNDSATQDKSHLAQAKSEARNGVELKALYYYPVNEVEQRPFVMQAPSIEKSLIDSGFTVNGMAKIELLVERTGHINAVNILDTNLPAPYPNLLQEIFKDMTYTPGLISGAAVRTRILIEVVYTDGVLSDAPSTPVNNRVLLQRLPHTPIPLPSDRHQRKSNPPSKQ